MPPEAKERLERWAELTGHRIETLRQICEEMAAHPDAVAHMAITRMHRDLFPDQYDDDYPTDAELDAIGAKPAPLQPGDVERILKQWQAAGERQAAVRAAYVADDVESR